MDTENTKLVAAPATPSPSTAARRLPWLPITSAHASAWTLGLTDYETGWFWNLIFNSLAAEPQGYLPDSPHLWMLTGAKQKDFWELHKSGLLASWKVREMDGSRMLCFPPLVQMLEKQRGRKPRSSLSPLTDFKNQNQNQREREPRAPAKGAHSNADGNEGTPVPTRLERIIGRAGKQTDQSA